LYFLVKQHNIGLLIEAENQTALNEGILKAVSEDFSHINKNACQYAENYLSIDNIMHSFEEFMLYQRKSKVQATNSQPGESTEVAASGRTTGTMDFKSN